jgi:DNA transformation protein and related proteins
MAIPSEFAAYCAELLSSLGPTRVKRMFGGHGFYVDDVFIAIATSEQLYLKADATSRPRYEAAGCEPFVYDAAGKRVALGYWTAPDDAMESPALMQPWARLAMESALRARNAKPVKRVGAAKKTTRPVAAPTKKKPALKSKR